MNIKYFFLLLTFFNALFAAEYVQHPKPKEPEYINPEWYSTLKRQVDAVPAKNSETQKEDEKVLFHLQKGRTVEDCERAKSEIFVSLENFFAKPLGPIEKEKLTPLAPFFEKLRNDGDFFVQQLKVDFPRDRPFVYLKKINPCVSKEVTKAYPSGHAVLSRLYAIVLGDLFPNEKIKLVERANQIAEDRVLVGMHHSSDIEVGKKIAVLLYGELQKSERYQSEFKKLKK